MFYLKIFYIFRMQFYLFVAPLLANALNCRDVLQDLEITFIDWPNLRKCLAEVNSETVSINTSSNIWRLLKMSFDGIDNVPMEAYKELGYTLTAIPLDELRNLSMERVEIVEAFGAIRSSDELQGFTTEQSALIAQKVRLEWMGKNPQTYSEYDLISMGEILCHMNTSDIEELHADAFKNAVEWIGNIKKCPHDRLDAFAKLAKHEDAFGEPSTWSKLDVSIVGNIINGLPQSDIATIAKDKLHLNRYYIAHSKNSKNGTGLRNSLNKLNQSEASSSENIKSLRKISDENASYKTQLL